MDDLAPDRILLLLLHDHRLAVAVDLEVEQRVSLGEHRAQAQGVGLERKRLAADAVDDAGHEARTAQAAGRPRAALLARLHLQGGSLVAGSHRAGV